MEWIKIKGVIEESNVIYLPQTMIKKMPTRLKVRFGQREMPVVLYTMESNLTEENTFNNPAVIKCSKNVFSELLIQDLATYQISYSGGYMNIGPVIGLLVGEQHYYYHNNRLKEFTDAMGVYPGTGGLFFIFKSSSIDLNEMCIYGLYYDYDSQYWKYGKFPVPSVIFKRAFQTQENNINELKRLFNIKIFNSVRLNKWEIYSLLKNNKFFNQYLPETKKLDNLKTFKSSIAKFSRVILKPAGLSRGRGICIVNKNNSGHFMVDDYRKKKIEKDIKLSRKELKNFLIKGNFFDRNYIIQPHLELAKINGSPFDMRVVMHKNEINEWLCSGIECRLAGSEDSITNIARGGQALSIIQTIQLAFGPSINPYQVEEDVIGIAMEFCDCMDATGELFAEFGLDLAIDVNRHYWFIEANVRPTFKGFKLIDYQIYHEICHAPILYAASIAGFGREKSR